MPFETALSRFSPQLSSILRLIAGLLFVEHGSAKLLGFPHVDMFDNLQILSPLGVAGILELFGGALIVVGLFTRPIAFILSGEMAAAYFIAHAPRGFFPLLNQGEAAILFCFIFLYIAAAGPGPLSLDAVIRRKA
jgi:putative oxidoreductase